MLACYGACCFQLHLHCLPSRCKHPGSIEREPCRSTQHRVRTLRACACSGTACPCSTVAGGACAPRASPIGRPACIRFQRACALGAPRHAPRPGARHPGGQASSSRVCLVSRLAIGPAAERGAALVRIGAGPAAQILTLPPSLCLAVCMPSKPSGAACKVTGGLVLLGGPVRRRPASPPDGFAHLPQCRLRHKQPGGECTCCLRACQGVK